jgi:hypothetical protein
MWYYTRMNTSTTPRFVKFAILAGIVVTMNIFAFVAMNTIFPEPLFEDYCKTTLKPLDTELSCVTEGGVWQSTAPQPEAVGVKESGYCDTYSACQPAYDAARSAHDMLMYVILVVSAVVALVVGILPLGNSIVSAGISYGGVLLLIASSIRYFDVAGKYGQLAIAGFAFLALLYIGVRKFKDTE